MVVSTKDILFALAVVLWGSVASAGTIQVGGTGSALEVLRLLGEAFSRQQPDTEIVVLPSLGSTGGLRALAAGRIDVAVAVAPAAAAPAAAAPAAATMTDEHGRVWIWTRSPVAIVAGESVPVRDVSTRDLVEIYSARRVNWPDGTRIRPILRPAPDNANTVLRGLDPAMAEALSAAERLWGASAAVTDQDAATALETVPGAIGPLVLGQLIAERRTLRPLALDGIEPSLAAVAAGTYRLVNTYQLVTAEPPAPEAEAFLAYLGSAAGRDLAESLGYVAAGP